MPRTWTQEGPHLAIRLQDTGIGTTYVPGDTIIGQVVRRSHTVSPRAQVVIKLLGRNKVKIQVQRSDGTSSYRSIVKLIEVATTTQNIFDGPIHIPHGGEPLSWPFAITIPTHVSPNLTASPNCSWLPLERDRIAQQRLFSTASSSSSRMDAYVEYWLEATLHNPGNEMHSQCDAVLPIIIRNYHDQPVGDFGMKLWGRTSMVRSFLLVPGMESSDQSLKLRMKKFFGTSSVPKFSCRMEIVLPGIIQLEPPTAADDSLTKPISVLIRFVPVWKQTSEVLHGIPHEVGMVAMRIHLETVIEAFADGTFGTHSASANTRTKILSWRSTDRPDQLTCLPCTDDDTHFVNIGKRFNLRIGYNGPVTSGLPVSEPVLASVETYNFEIKHSLNWKIQAGMAGELLTFQGITPVQVVDSIHPCRRTTVDTSPPPPPPPPPLQRRRTDSWIRPPPDDDPPPTFAEAQREDALRQMS